MPAEDGAGGSEALGATGAVYERSLTRGRRRRGGVFYTPAPLAAGLVRAALDGWHRRPRALRVCDPSCGGGAFLLAAADELAAQTGSDRAEVAAALWGADVDSDAVAVARRVLVDWVSETEPSSTAATERCLDEQLVAGDPLLDGASVWGARGARLEGPFHLVVGNPPFQNQLGRSTARVRSYTSEVRERLGLAPAAYTDTSALFLLAALDLVGPHGRVLLVEPQSFLAARDAAPVREEVLRRGRVIGLWVDDGAHFDAAVQVCAPLVERSARSGVGDPVPVQIWTGAAVEPAVGGRSPASIAETAGGSWAPLLSGVRGIPPVDLDGGGDARTVGDVATVIAGFRQHFYGLAPYVSEARADDPIDRAAASGSEMRLTTSGLIDPANDRWGRATTRFDGRRYQRPVVDVDELGRSDPELGRWAATVAVPKVLVAAQTRVVEVVVDRDGSRWPSVPVVAVCAPAAQLSRLAAALASPAVSAWACAQVGGAALSADAVKLSAGHIRSIPLPGRDLGAWDAAARSFEAAERCALVGDRAGWSEHLDEVGHATAVAYGVSDEVVAWWRSRRPPFRG